MTTSQIISAIASTCATISGICAVILPQLQSLPPEYQSAVRYVSLVGIITGIVVTAFNQSLSQSHVSVPVEVAKQIVNQLPKSSVPEALKEQVKV